MDENEYFDAYLEDMKEHLELLNESLLKLDKSYEDKEIINTIFRSFHTMKGSTATMKYSHSAKILHKMEDLLQEMREGRLKADSNLVKLLFECHDFVENFIEQVIATRNEDGLDCPEILKQIEEYIKKTAQPLKKAVAKFIEPEPETDEIILSDFQMDYIKRKVSSGYKVHIVNLKIADDCMFKAIRAWMAYNEIAQIGEMIWSYPKKPSETDFSDSSFEVKSNEIKAIIISEKYAIELLVHLNDALLEMDVVEVKEYLLEDTTLKNIVNNIIDGDSSDSDKYNYPEEYIEEIKNHVKLCEQYCIESAHNLGNAKCLSNIWRSFHIIKGLSGFIKYMIIYDISAETEKLIDDCMKFKMQFGEQQLDNIATSLTYIKELCNDLFLVENKGRVKEIDDYLKMLSNRICVKQNSLDLSIEDQEISNTELKLEQMLIQDEKISLKNVLEEITVSTVAKTETKPQSFIRVPESKVDSLVDMLGELLIIQSLHKQEVTDKLTEASLCSKLLSNISRMEKITKDIQTISMSLRMVSLKQSFQKLERIGHDTAVELEKDIDISINGENTEIDRSIVEKIQDPLMHLVRNSISHGIETKDLRIEKGKPIQGKVTINAYNKRGFVFIEITDDGKGLSLEKIYEKAIEKKLIDPGKNYTEDEIIKFIYLPGFSTEEAINNISGRGVGMNVVEIEINRIGGKIEIVNSVGVGCTFILKIPINLATVNGTIVNIFGGRYIIPTLNIKQLLKPENNQWINIKGKTDMIKIRDEIIQIIPIDKILGVTLENIDYRNGMVIVIELDKKFKAIPISNVIGKQEIVVKPLGYDFRSLDFISGATILGDGKVSLILDVESLFKND